VRGKKLFQKADEWQSKTWRGGATTKAQDTNDHEENDDEVEPREQRAVGPARHGRGVGLGAQ